MTDQLDAQLDWSTLELQSISFNNVVISVPSGLRTYFTRTNVTTDPNPVEAKAEFNATTGVVTWTMTSIDPITGGLVEDPFAGFLPPDIANGIGEGYVTYTIRPKSGLITRTRICNQASIVFDVNAPILTPVVANTIDAGAPASHALPLPAQSGRTFAVQWTGQDDAGGSGIASCDVYVSTNGASYTRWLQGTTGTSAIFTGQLGGTYSFYSVACDNVGNQQTPPASAQATTTIPTNAPVLAVVSDVALRVGQALAVTNLVQGTPVGSWQYSLGPGSPASASINPTNGVFNWVADCAYGNTTNAITVWVADSGQTNLADAATFIATVGECVQPSLGRVILLTGDNGRVPINLISSVGLTNLDMTLLTASNRFTGLTIEPLVPEICTNALTMVSNGCYWLSLVTGPGQFLVGTQQVAWLCFTALTNQCSAFVGLTLTNLAGHDNGGHAVANFAPQSGRAVVLGEEPLLECLRSTNPQPSLILYGKPASGYAVDARTNLSTGYWQTALTNLTVGTNLFLTMAAPPSSSSLNFYRALRTTATDLTPVLQLNSAGGGQFTLILRGQRGYDYAVECRASLTAAAQWASWQELSLTNQSTSITVPSSGSQQFYRARLVGPSQP